MANNASNGVSVLLGDGAGGFAPRTDVAAGTAPTKVVVEDLNGDLDPDLVVANWGLPNPSGASVLLGTGTGGFDPATFYATGVGGTWSVAVGDLDDDDRADLLVANSERNGLNVSNGVSVLLNTTVPVAPAAPTIIRNATAGDGVATVSWTAPAADGGSAITGYVVTPYDGYSPRPSTAFASTDTTQTLTGLVNGTTYRFRVQAVNAIGTSGYSTVTNPVTPTAPTVPGAPTIIRTPPLATGRQRCPGRRPFPMVGRR